MAQQTDRERINVPAAINHFGGTANLVRLAANHQPAWGLTEEAVKKWRQRGRVPSHHIVAMVSLGAALGKPFDLARYITTEDSTP